MTAVFTGIVSDIGDVLDVREQAEGLRRLTIGCGYDPATIDIGASIACSGICLTVVARGREAVLEHLPASLAAVEPLVSLFRPRAFLTDGGVAATETQTFAMSGIIPLDIRPPVVIMNYKKENIMTTRLADGKGRLIRSARRAGRGGGASA